MYTPEIHLGKNRCYERHLKQHYNNVHDVSISGHSSRRTTHDPRRITHDPTTNNPRLTTHCPRPTTFYQRPTTNYPRPTTNYPRPIPDTNSTNSRKTVGNIKFIWRQLNAYYKRLIKSETADSICNETISFRNFVSAFYFIYLFIYLLIYLFTYLFIYLYFEAFFYKGIKILQSSNFDFKDIFWWSKLMY